MTFETTTRIRSKPERVWQTLVDTGLFKGQRTYSVTSEGDGTVTFAMREVFSGLLAPLITKSIPDLQPSFDEFATSLKMRSEQP